MTSSARIDKLRGELAEFVRFEVPPAAPLETLASSEHGAFQRKLVSYPSEDGRPIPAYLMIPSGEGPFPAVVVHHQHNSQYHLGKSEPAGLAGDELQAFGPALARRGVVVLAPDSICFEDRRRRRSGREPAAEDPRQHYNEFAYRLVSGDLLARKVLADSALAVSTLAALDGVRADRLGMLGHSYGGNTVLFHAPLDERVRFACASGSACSYRARMAAETGIELAQVIPGFAQRFDIEDLVRCMAPRPLLLASATGDPYSQDADAITDAARPTFDELGASSALEHLRADGEHELTRDRFENIVDWTHARSLAVS
jgi:dienelactone hydrolase